MTRRQKPNPVDRVRAAIGRRLQKPDPALADFDPTFYGTFYPDLHILKTAAALRRHYNRHGKDEGRFASLAMARAHFERVNGPPPADFDLKLYQQLNPDLSKSLTNPFQYELHFLEFGRFEERLYSLGGSPADAWQNLLNVYDFNLLNESWLPRGGVKRAEAIARMEAEGIERIAPIARGYIFDPAFYRAYYAAEGDHAALYREWLHEGFPAGRAPNEAQAIAGMLGGNPYPDCFDWQRFCRIHRIEEPAPYPARIRALVQLFEQPVDDRARECIAGPGAARLLGAMGSYNLIRARYREAANAFRLATEASAPTARLLLLLGDALRGLGDQLGALVSYESALTLPDCAIWALIHATTIMLSQKQFREAFRLIEAHATQFRAHELFDGFVDEVAGKVYSQVADTMRGMISDDRQDTVLDTYADGRLGEITDFLRLTKIGEPLCLAAQGPRRIVMLACLDLPQCTFYRVEQKRRLLVEQDFEVEVFDFGDPAPFISALPGAAAAIFYRVPCYPKIVEAILYANSLGIDTFFDIDDLVFTRDFPDAFESYENQISRQEYYGLCHGVALYRQAISLCHGAIVSTRPLAETIAPMVAGGRERTFVVPNGLDDRNKQAALFSKNNGTPRDGVSIFYGSGTKAHNRDFSDIVAPALLDIFAEYPKCRLVLVGYLGLDKRFDPFADRIRRFPFIADLDSYWAILASCEINISALHEGPIADAKSEIKWLEAAILGIPSIVSATQTFRDVLTDGETGLLARDTDDWRRHFRALIEDDGLRRTIGARARTLALREYGAEAVQKKLVATLVGREVQPRDSTTGAVRKKSILICNVYFAPQSYGGATRVVEDNINLLLDRYGDEFAVSILSTYKGLSVGALRVDEYRGCPVYRIGTPVEKNMDWRPFNDAVLPAFRRVLEVVEPDLVHFHCVQRLTASLVEETLRASIPYIVTVHDAWWISDHQFLVDQDDRLVAVDDPFDTMLPSGVARTESLYRLQRLKSLLNSADTTLAVSHSFTELYRLAGIAEVKSCENGLGLLQQPSAKVTPRSKVVLGHIGGRSVHKGAALLEGVLRLHRFANLELVMVDGALDVGEKTIEMWGSTPVTLRAPVPSAAVDELYSQIDVLVAPSVWPESYGLVVREAIHFGCWVIVSDRGALAQDVVEGENGFIVDPSHSEALAAVLTRIDNEVARFKVPPAETKLRRSSEQLDELVALYREINRDERSSGKPRDRIEPGDFVVVDGGRGSPKNDY